MSDPSIFDPTAARSDRLRLLKNVPVLGVESFFMGSEDLLQCFMLEELQREDPALYESVKEGMCFALSTKVIAEFLRSTKAATPASEAVLQAFLATGDRKHLAEIATHQEVYQKEIANGRLTGIVGDLLLQMLMQNEAMCFASYQEGTAVEIKGELSIVLNSDVFLIALEGTARAHAIVLMKTSVTPQESSYTLYDPNFGLLSCVIPSDLLGNAIYELVNQYYLSFCSNKTWFDFFSELLGFKAEKAADVTVHIYIVAG